MFSFITFLISLILLSFLFLIKGLEIYYGKKIFLESLSLKCDNLILGIILKIKYWWSHVNFRNTKLIFSWIIARIKQLIIAIKRRFDHKQSHFFTKRIDTNIPNNKGSVSFFLKNVSDYKKSLREGK